MKRKWYVLMLLILTAACSKEANMLDEPPMVPADFQMVSTTTFASMNGYTVRGTLEIWKQDSVYLFNFIDFFSSNGPDLDVWLSAGPEPSRVLDLGDLKANSGNFSYTYIDTAGEIASLSCALIWCDRFSVAFGKAAFAR